MVWVHVFMVFSCPHPTIFCCTNKASIDAELQGQQKKRKKRWVDPTWVAQVRAREKDLFFREEMPPFWANSSHFDPKKYRPFTSFINIKFVYNLFQQRLQEIARNILKKKQDILRSTASMHHHPFFFVACRIVAADAIPPQILVISKLPEESTWRTSSYRCFRDVRSVFFVLHHLTVCKNRTPYRNWERNALMFSRWSMTYIYICVWHTGWRVCIWMFVWYLMLHIASYI